MMPDRSHALPLLVLSLIACLESPPVLESVSVEPAEFVPAAIRVSFRTSVPTQARIEFGPDQTYGRSTPLAVEATEEHELTLLGLPVGETTHFRIVAATTDGELIIGGDRKVEVDRAPSSVPELELMESIGGAWGPWTVATFDRVSDPQVGGAYIADADANVVWYYTVEGALVYTAEPTPDGREILILAEDGEDQTATSVHVVALDGSGAEVIPVTNGHHALVAAPREGVRFAYLAWEEREWEGEQVVGDRVVEVLDDGSEVVVWDAFDHVVVEEHADWYSGHYGDAADWTHANGLFYDAESDAYMVSLYYRERLIYFDRATAETIWTFGKNVPDFFIVNDDGFTRQHAPEFHDGSLYVFDNAVGGTPSRAVEYQLDPENQSAWMVWEWMTPEESTVGVMGDLDVLPTGQVAIAWGDLGQLCVVNRDGTLAERIDVETAVITPTIAKLRTLYP